MLEQQLALLVKEIDQRTMGKDSYVVAIDGMCGSGKSTLASLLAQYYECNVFHMDDYFLPMERKTKERLSEAGGNVDYERFRTEVIDGILTGKSNWYRPYHCDVGRLGEPISVEHKRLTIVEGSYSLHPTLVDGYDFKVFLTVDSEEQIERIRLRNGEIKLQRFINEWIPLENEYFTKSDILNRCDLNLRTSTSN